MDERGFVRRSSLWQISVTTCPQAEETVSALIEKAFGRLPVVYVDAEKNVSVVSVYCDKSKEWIFTQRSGLKSALRSAAFTPLQSAHFKVSVKKLWHEDWAESWKKHFHPLEIGPALLVKPSWSKRRPRKGQAIVVLDPGLSFGTGQHPTTAFCLRQLVTRRETGATQSFLDIGTGSGILAIAAAKLGYSPVHAFDFDPDAVRVAQANAVQNGVLRQVRLSHRNLTKLPVRSRTKYDFICANLISNLLLDERERILSRLRRDGGVLAMAGILKREFSQVQQAYEKAGLRLVASRTEKEWRSGCFA